ncbi:MAG: hypothetical protein NVS3B26_23990 [Mycobacteriales bacterium]
MTWFAAFRPGPDSTAETVAKLHVDPFVQGAPQVVQPHAALPRFRELLREHVPDVLAELLRAGAVEAPLPTQMPPTLLDREQRPGDERITLLLSRRSTLDWVLRRAVATQSGITIRPGACVHGREEASLALSRIVRRSDASNVGPVSHH